MYNSLALRVNLIPVYLSLGRKGENQNWETRSQRSVSTPIFSLHWDFWNKAGKITDQSYTVRNELKNRVWTNWQVCHDWEQQNLTSSTFLFRTGLATFAPLLRCCSHLCPGAGSHLCCQGLAWGNSLSQDLPEPGESSVCAAGTHCTNLCRTRSCWTSTRRFNLCLWLSNPTLGSIGWHAQSTDSAIWLWASHLFGFGILKFNCGLAVD